MKSQTSLTIQRESDPFQTLVDVYRAAQNPMLERHSHATLHAVRAKGCS
jgi:hypothetical protein